MPSSFSLTKTSAAPGGRAARNRTLRAVSRAHQVFLRGIGPGRGNDDGRVTRRGYAGNKSRAEGHRIVGNVFLLPACFFARSIKKQHPFWGLVAASQAAWPSGPGCFGKVVVLSIKAPKMSMWEFDRDRRRSVKPRRNEMCLSVTNSTHGGLGRAMRSRRTVAVCASACVARNSFLETVTCR